MTTREQLHRIVELLPDSEVKAALRFVEYLRDTRRSDEVARMLMNAAEDDEPLTPEEADSLERAAEEARSGQTVPWEEVRRQIG